MINFMLLKFLNAIARPRQINWRTEGIKTSGSIFFFLQRQDHTMIGQRLGILQSQKLMN